MRTKDDDLEQMKFQKEADLNTSMEHAIENDISFDHQPDNRKSGTLAHFEDFDDGMLEIVEQQEQPSTWGQSDSESFQPEYDDREEESAGIIRFKTFVDQKPVSTDSNLIDAIFEKP